MRLSGPCRRRPARAHRQALTDPPGGDLSACLREKRDHRPPGSRRARWPCQPRRAAWRQPIDRPDIQRAPDASHADYASTRPSIAIPRWLSGPLERDGVGEPQRNRAIGGLGPRLDEDADGRHRQRMQTTATLQEWLAVIGGFTSGGGSTLRLSVEPATSDPDPSVPPRRPRPSSAARGSGSRAGGRSDSAVPADRRRAPGAADRFGERGVDERVFQTRSSRSWREITWPRSAAAPGCRGRGAAARSRFRRARGAGSGDRTQRAEADLHPKDKLTRTVRAYQRAKTRSSVRHVPTRHRQMPWCKRTTADKPPRIGSLAARRLAVVSAHPTWPFIPRVSQRADIRIGSRALKVMRNRVGRDRRQAATAESDSLGGAARMNRMRAVACVCGSRRAPSGSTVTPADGGTGHADAERWCACAWSVFVHSTVSLRDVTLSCENRINESAAVAPQPPPPAQQLSAGPGDVVIT